MRFILNKIFALLYEFTIIMVRVNHNYIYMFSLRSKVANKILNLFFLNEEENFYINEIAKIIKEDPSNVYKKLIELKELGILFDEFQGKERYFSLNKKHPLLKEYKKIILKENGFEKNLKDEFGKIKGIESVYVFGSYVNQKLSSESDIDILVIGNFDIIKFQKAILKIQKLINREINSVEFTKEEFQKRKENKDPFLGDVFSKKYIKIL